MICPKVIPISSYCWQIGRWKYRRKVCCRWVLKENRKEISERRPVFAPFYSQRRVTMLEGCKITRSEVLSSHLPQAPRKFKCSVTLNYRQLRKGMGQGSGDWQLTKQLFEYQSLKTLVIQQYIFKEEWFSKNILSCCWPNLLVCLLL